MHPGEEQITRYLNALRKINADLAENDRAAVDDGRNNCLDLVNEDRQIAIEHMMRRQEVNEKVAGQIVDISRKYFCPGA